MNTLKRSSIMIRVISILSVVTMFTMCFVGGTFAKYTSSATGSDSTRVAKWDIKVSNANIVTTDTFTFDLFKTITDSDGTSNESDIKYTDGTIIAPGTSGYFDLVIKNDSEVNATYAIEYTVTNNNNIPVQFSVDGGTTWTNSLANVGSTIINMDATVTIKVQWKWVFDGNDTTDTDLGKDGTATLKVDAKVTATQVD